MSRLKVGSSIGPFPYRIVKQLGAGIGNMSDVYLATVGNPEKTSSFVVIKISKSQQDHSDFFEDTIFNEAERLRKLDHRGVVRILPIQTTNTMRVQPYAARAGNLAGNPWFLILEYLVGDSLADVLQNYRQLDTALAIEITRKIAQTLEYIHYNDLVHLDLKPENILFRRPLEAGGRVEPVLIDFGIARNTGQAGLEGRTLRYAPPERVLINRGNAPPETLPRPSPAMDIYSLGVVFYQMLTGNRPFEGRTTRSISSAILEGKPTRPSKYSNLVWKELDDLVMDMLNRDPIQRPTAGELVAKLDDLRSQPAYQLSTSSSGQTVKIAIERHYSWRKIFISKISSISGLLVILILEVIVLNYFGQSSVKYIIKNLTNNFSFISQENPKISTVPDIVSATPTIIMSITPATIPSIFTPPRQKFWVLTSTPVPEYSKNTPVPTKTRRPTSTPVPEIIVPNPD